MKKLLAFLLCLMLVLSLLVACNSDGDKPDDNSEGNFDDVDTSDDIIKGDENSGDIDSSDGDESEDSTDTLFDR